VCERKQNKQRRNKRLLGDMQDFAPPQRLFEYFFVELACIGGILGVTTALKLKIQ